MSQGCAHRRKPRYLCQSSSQGKVRIYSLHGGSRRRTQIPWPATMGCALFSFAEKGSSSLGIDD